VLFCDQVNGKNSKEGSESFLLGSLESVLMMEEYLQSVMQGNHLQMLLLLVK